MTGFIAALRTSVHVLLVWHVFKLTLASTFLMLKVNLPDLL